MAKSKEPAVSLKDRMLAKSTIKLTAMIQDSVIFGKSTHYRTKIPMLNIAHSGDVAGGFSSGLHVIAGPSKHFKSLFAVLEIQAYLAQEPEGMVLFYDSEFGTPGEYFTAFNIDMGRIVHTPITDIEELKMDIMAQLSGLTRKDKVMIVVDSVGNLASKKEVDDALAGKSVADMTRAKQLKSLFRMVTPHLTIKDIPMKVVNHTYMTQEMYSKTVVSGGTGIYYSANEIWTIGRRQDKDGDELAGYEFIINIEKSRHVKEKSKFPITVSFDGGIRRWSGMLDLAVEGKYVIKPSKGNYALASEPDIIYKEADIKNNNDFWFKVFRTTDFSAWIKKEFILSENNIMNETDFADEVEALAV